MASERMFGAPFRSGGHKGPFLGFGQLAGGLAEVASEGHLAGGSAEVASAGLFGAPFRPDGPKGPFSRFRPAGPAARQKWPLKACLEHVFR